MSRAKLFIENFFAYGFIQVINKIVPFLLLPVITRLLKDPSEFGIYDMFTQIIGFGSPLIMLGMYDAMFREYFEIEDQVYRYNVTTTAQRIVLFTSIIGSLVLFFFSDSLSKVFFGKVDYADIVIFSSISLLVSTNKTIISAPTRIQNKRKVYIASGLISSAGGYFLAILLILLGYSYFGLIYSNIFTAAILLIFFFSSNNRFFTLGKFDKKVAKELFKIGLPLLPTFLIYWVYNSMDKIMIANILGTGELGIYSIGSKVAHISMFIYTAFSGGWSYFAFSTMKDQDQVQMNSKVAEYLGAISFASLFLFYPFIKLIFQVLFSADYARGYIVVSYLYLSPLLLMLFQVIGNQFLVIKKSYLSTISLSTGAFINIALNALLIPKIGVEGAAIATLVGYIITVTIVIIITKKMNQFILTKRFILVCLLTVLYILINRLYFTDKFIHQLTISLIMVNAFAFLYKEEIVMIVSKMKNFRR